MSNFAAWAETTWADGTSPYLNAANLNKNEDMLTLITGELNYSKNLALSPMVANFYNNNTKKIKDYNDSSEWSTSGTINISDDYDDAIMGACCLKVLETDNSSGLLTAYQTLGSSVDFTTFTSGRAAVSTDYVLFAYYITDATYFSSIVLRLGTDSSNYYYFTLSGGNLITGWNFKFLRKDFFNSTGSPDWSAVTYIYHGVTTLANAQNEYVLFDYLGLIHRDATRVQSNPWVSNDGSGNYDEELHVLPGVESTIYFDDRIGKFAFQLMNETGSTNMLETFCTVNSFSTKVEAYSKVDDNGCAVMWYIDSSNYLIVSVESDELVIYEYVSGSGSDVATATINTSIEKDDRMELYVDKIGDVVYGELRIDGQQSYYVAWETSFDADEEGCVGLCKPNTGQEYAVTDFVVGHNQALLPPFMSQGLTLKAIKYEDETLFSHTTIQTDDYLYLKLPANGLFKCDLFMAVDGTDAGQDVTVAWDIDTCTAESHRFINGVGENATSLYNSDAMMSQAQAFTSERTYGVVSSGWTYVRETGMVSTGYDGATIWIKWAQGTSSATSITCKAKSYLIAKRIG